VAYANSTFAEETLEDHPHNTLKELKTRNSNEDGSKMTTLQCD
jgi:hypothetical protein